MVRKISHNGLRKKLDDIIRERTRMRDKMTCQWCGKQNVKLDVSHVKPKGRCTYLRWDMNNVKLLCFNCHINRWHARSEGVEWFKNKYPERWAYLCEREHVRVKTRQFMEDTLEKLKDDKAQTHNL